VGKLTPYKGRRPKPTRNPLDLTRQCFWLAGMNLVGKFAQFALDSVGEINDALHVAIADGADMMDLGRRE